MATLYDIDLVRALLIDRINDESIFLASFYEQIKGEEAIARYVDELKELIALQNQEKSKSNYKAMGIVSQSGNANIVNIKQNYILPFDFQVRLDIELADRDYVLDKIKTMINTSKGKKYELALKDDGDVLVFAEPEPNALHEKPILTNNVFINYGGGDPSTASNFYSEIQSDYAITKATLGSNVTTHFVYNNVFYRGVYTHQWTTTTTSQILYDASVEKKSIVLDSPADLNTALTTFLNDSGRTHRGYLRVQYTDLTPTRYYRVSLGSQSLSLVNLGATPQFYKISVSFNTIQSQEPYINNGLDRVFLFFGGSITIVDGNVGLGNDIVRYTIQEGKDTGTIYSVEPSEFPASLAVTDDGYQTWDTGYKTIDRNMAIDNKLVYNFVYDKTNTLYNNLYKYARFGLGIIDPNQVYTIKEYRYDFGVLVVDKVYAKLGEVSFSNTNGDVMMINATFKVGAY